MDIPRVLGVFFLLSCVGLQIFLFRRIRGYLRSRVKHQKQQRLLSGLVASFFFLMLYPLVWRAILGLGFYEPYPWLLRGFVAFWVFGSMASALILLVYDVLHRVILFFSPPPQALPDFQRRNFLKKSVGVAAAAPFVLSGYGVLLERRRFEVEHFDLPVNGLSSALSQLSVVQLTDIHVGPFMPEEELVTYVEAVNRLEPDLIALTGDFISSSPDEVAPCVNALGRLKSRYGIFACLGNHDVFVHVEDDLTRLFGEKGIKVLRNDAVSIGIGNTALNILGINDLGWGKPNLSRALKVAETRPGELRLLLSHRPEVFPEAADKGLDVVLSGHYHGGQIKLSPGPKSLSIARFMTPYAEGLFHLSRRFNPAGNGAKDAVLFVGRGIGVTALPIRINCPPQIAHLRLIKA